MTSPKSLPLHLQLAERGKVCALRGDHNTALTHYRQAMSLAVDARLPEVVFRHYLECCLESLEHMGAYQDILEYCDRALDHYQQNPPRNELAQCDLATILQRRGVVLFKQGCLEEATETLARASTTARTNGHTLALADSLLSWLRSRFTVSAERILAEQHRHHYFSVRPNNVRPEFATDLTLPAERTPGRSVGGISHV